MDTLEYLTKEVQKFCEDRDWDQFHGPKDLAIGLSTGPMSFWICSGSNQRNKWGR